MTETTQKFLSTIHAHGMDPRVLAEWLKKGIENDQFLVVPYAHGPRMAELAMERFRWYADPENLPAWEAKQMEPPTEEDILLASEREGYDMSESLRQRRAPAGDAKPPKDPIGFGKARADLDWIDPRKRFEP